MTLREATTDDIEAIRAVAQASWETDYPGILSRETVQEGIEEWYGPEELTPKITSDDTLVLVADTDTGIRGFAHAVEDENGGSILRLYVAPDHRREGIGGDLLQYTCEALRERSAERIQAMVLAENDPGNEFYQQFGFSLIEENETVIDGTTYRENVYIAE
jgi:ribosomal protein S18 acetylase RimI-like enzyme